MDEEEALSCKDSIVSLFNELFPNSGVIDFFAAKHEFSDKLRDEYYGGDIFKTKIIAQFNQEQFDCLVENGIIKCC
jgi:hypothetical protein